MVISERVKEILSWYGSDNAGVRNNLARLLCHGRLGGTGKMVVLPVDQGFEHGPARSFAPNPLGYDPCYHYSLAIKSGCSAYAAPFGQLAAASSDFIGEVPLIVKVNSGDSLFASPNPIPAVTCSVRDALQLGATAVGFTIYPGSSYKKEMYEEIREMASEARSLSLPVVIWSYPRGEGISKEGETALDIVAYAAQIAAQLGAHIIKVKPPTDHIEQKEAQKVYEKYEIDRSSLSARVQHVIQSAFAGRRIVIFSGGAAKGDQEVLEEIHQLNKGGSFGSIIGRNSFQRKPEEAVKLLHQIMDIYCS